MASVTKDLGIVSAYGYAKAGGYTGTEEEFQAIFNEFTEDAPGLLDRLDEAVDDAETAEAAAVAANTAAQAAKTAAENAASTFTTDTTLTVSGKAADAKVTGDNFTQLSTAFNEIAEVATDVVSVNRVLFLNNDQPFNGVLESVAQQTVKVCGQNILDTSVVSNGTIKNDSGTDVADYNSRYYVNMIPVIPNEKLYMNFGVQRIYEYDGNKDWLRRTSASNQDKAYGVFTVPSDTYYIQVQFNRTDSINLNEAQINRGSVGLNYAAYSETEYTATASGVEANFPALTTVWSDGSAFDIVTTNGMRPTEEFKTATENNTITIPECGTYDIWTIATATDDYSTPLGYDGADLDITYQEFLDKYFNPYVGNNNGYRVARRSLGDDSGHALELVEYDFIPEHYNRVVMISAGMNACELAPMWGLAYFIQALMDGTDEDGLNYIRNNVRLKILPVINPWGFDQSPMDYYNANGVRINKNFNWKGSWEAMTGADATYRGSYPDSEAESKILKNWVNENAQIAELWIDCHSDVAGNTPHLNVAFVSHNGMYSAVASIQNAICDYYHEIGTLPSGTTDVNYSVAQLGNGYPKTVYSWDMCNVPAIMLEQYPNGTTYGASGTLNNSSYDIKNYVLMLRAYILGILKSNAKTFTAVGDAWKAYQAELLHK